MEGMPHANHVDNNPSYLPDMDPGYRGGGTYTAQNIEPTIEAYENIFGPSARDIKTDLQRFKRHGRWHLPDILKGPNTYLTDRVDGLITDAATSPFTSRILPYKYMDQPDGKIKWNVWSFDEGLASRVPYESAARTLTQSKKSYAGYMVRSGAAIVLEHNFMMSDAGRLNFKRQLQQLVGTIQSTNDLDVHMALILAPSHQKEMREKYIEQDKTSSQICREFIDLFGFVQKNQNAMDILIEEAKTQLKLWGAPMPNFLMCNSKLTFQLTMTPDRTNFVTQGAEGQKRLKAGPDLPSYRGIDIMHTRAFSIETGAPPRDILRRRVRVAEYYRIKPHPENWVRQFQFYNEERDTWFSLSFRDLLQYARIDPRGPVGGQNAALPGMMNHGNINRFAGVPLHTQIQIEAPPPVVAPNRLGIPIAVANNDPIYDYMRNAFLAVFNKTLRPEYTWVGRKFNDHMVYMPGAYQEGIQYNNYNERNANNVPTGNVLPFDILVPECWDQLPRPLRDALIMLTPEQLQMYSVVPLDAAETQRRRNVFHFLSQSIARYPRETAEIGPGYFFHERFNVGGPPAHNRTFLPNFSAHATLPEAFNVDQYALGGGRVPNGAEPALNLNTFLNFHYDLDHLKCVYHFKQYNRYAISSHVIRPRAYQTANRLQDALDLNVDHIEHRIVHAPAPPAYLVTGDSFARNLGAFYCPNHFKCDRNSIAPTYNSFGDLVGQNVIFNTEIVNFFTHRKSFNGARQAVVPLEDVDYLWKEKQWESTFIFEVLSHPERHQPLLDGIRQSLVELYQTFKADPAAPEPCWRAKLTSKLFYARDDSDAMLGPNMSGFVQRFGQYITNNAPEFWVPSFEELYHHYWYFPKADRPEEEVLAISDADVVAANNWNPAAGAILTFKQALVRGQIHDYFHLRGAFITMAGYLFPQLMTPQARATNFLTKPVIINDFHVTQQDALDLLHCFFARLFGDQEIAFPARWSTNPLDNVIQPIPLELIDMPPPPPPPVDPPYPGQGNNRLRAPAGTEHLEVVVIRPNIEHFMLGMIMGFGGETLGSTFWGQTELSCYDDSMHGIWGMSYKYHSRAVVINTKNLVRIWDIAYDGYVGGKDDTYVAWTNPEDTNKFKEDTMDVTKHYRGKSMMVMAFDHGERVRNGFHQLYDENWKANWPSPIMFYDEGGHHEAKLPLEYDNIHVVDTEQFRVFNSPLYQNAYKPYMREMPNFTQLHRIRKNAALAAVENEVSSDSLAFQGTMRILDTQGHLIEETLGSGHHGPDFIGVASLRAGKGYKFSSQPNMQRLV